jgi:hypothetical protein
MNILNKIKIAFNKTLIENKFNIYKNNFIMNNVKKYKKGIICGVCSVTLLNNYYNNNKVIKNNIEGVILEETINNVDEQIINYYIFNKRNFYFKNILFQVIEYKLYCKLYKIKFIDHSSSPPFKNFHDIYQVLDTKRHYNLIVNLQYDRYMKHFNKYLNTDSKNTLSLSKKDIIKIISNINNEDDLINDNDFINNEIYKLCAILFK